LQAGDRTKLLVLASTLDLRYRLGCTPAWWQLLKAFHERGDEVIAIPYLGDPVESLWWRTYPNPCAFESKLAYHATDSESEQPNGRPRIPRRATRFLIDRRIRPRWHRHLRSVLAREKDVDAVLMLNMPLNHFTGIPTAIREEFGVKLLYYDGDLPTILPKDAISRGFRFSYYEDADLSEYDVFFSNSKGALPDLMELGARRAYPLYYAADPDLFRPMNVAKDCDVSFYGHGDRLREEWMNELIAKPSEALPDARFVVGGDGFKISLGRAERVGPVRFSRFPEFVSRSLVNLNITRTSHANVLASATARPFELAACGACIVSQPSMGIEEWFEPGKEIIVAHDYREAVDTYRGLLDDRDAAAEFGGRARERVLASHTFRHRAEAIARIIGSVGRTSTPVTETEAKIAS
jgi:hypothetical protein